MDPVEKKEPAHDLLLTTLTLVIRSYGMLVMATFLPAFRVIRLI
jgi:hypothetical protein